MERISNLNQKLTSKLFLRRGIPVKYLYFRFLMMDFRRSIKKVSYYRSFFPFRLNLLLFLLMVLAARSILLGTYGNNSSYYDMMVLMVKIAIAFSFLVLGLSLLTTSFSLLYFLFRKAGKNKQWMDWKTEEVSGTVRIEVHIRGLIKPLLGYSKIRLLDEDLFSTPWIQEQARGFSFCDKQHFQADILLPRVNEYHFSEMQISFQDFLHFFSFTISVPVWFMVYRLPEATPQPEWEVIPFRNDQEEVHSDRMQKAEGDWLRYKNFEASDDIRRIVWKFFARNRELVVRIPETQNPYTSKLEWFASFYMPRQVTMYPAHLDEMLHAYKNSLWSVHEALKTKNFDPQFIPDQTVNMALSEGDSCARTIAKTQWQSETHASAYYRPSTGSILCIHSLSDPGDVKNICEQWQPDQLLLLVRIAGHFGSSPVRKTLAAIFLRPNPDSLSPIRNTWFLHPLRRRLLRNEKQLIQMVKQYSIPFDLIG